MNKSFRNIALSALLTVGAFSAITYTSCNKDECKDVVCANGGTCSGGNCTCTTGYEGTTCQTLSVVKFTKTWSVSENPGSLVYSCTIAPSGASVTAVIISPSFANNFFTNNITGTVSGNVLTIPSQKPDANSNYNIQGSLTYANGTLSSTYTITNIGSGSTVNESGTWQ